MPVKLPLRVVRVDHLYGVNVKSLLTKVYIIFKYSLIYLNRFLHYFYHFTLESHNPT